ncbi:YkgJ family cysteine cluster protein [Terrimonas sp. NA20]|uniref:YkgJ family cysteine cluster protein n=1 Tax=Terrimonas ginsenosidimutans TaxID=2908004 RepID=A0ABS9KYB7_9BACT|nr:YkgJ family cysteine cluster protein [Terrimonas ginsenosidimutans]MCG2617310.1 YkgJ family cysteine cluster protein [Terrimonas ginsenosidimutans]
MDAINLRAFKKAAAKNKGTLRRFLSKLEKQPPRGIEKTTAVLEKEVWAEVDCLTCANCCKTMTPTFNVADIKRISKHFGQTTEEFSNQWLRREKGGDRDWINKTEPCQFLNLKDNKCSIYAVRPADCAGFPHLQKKLKDYVHVHKQNVEFCPATYKMVQKMQTRINTNGRE